MRTRPIALALVLAFTLAACGVKSDLEKPTTPTQKAEKDPSKPPSPIGK